MSNATPGTKACKACGETIPADSRICSKCSEYQAGWRNELRYWSAVAGFLAVLGSGAVYMAGVLKAGADHFWPADQLVLDFDTFSDITIVNPSGQFVLIKHLMVRAAYPGQTLEITQRWDINQTVEPNRSLKVELLKLAGERFRGLHKDVFGTAPGPYAQKLSDAEKTKIFAYQGYDDYVPAFLKSGGTGHHHLDSDIGKAITTFACKADLGTFFLQSQVDRTLSIPCIGVIRRRTK